ncbi:MAG: biopolymer transporter ExbD [Sulfurimonas sp.]|nr:biopolymer transporter ExbD [Sulfurimonas sp.]
MRRRESITPDLTPIIDVVFLILIFFLVSSTFKKDELSLDLMLPSSTHSSKPINKDQLSLELTTTSVAFKGISMSFEKLDNALLQVLDKESTLDIRIDKKVEYARVMKLFDLLKKHDLNNLALVSEVSKE